ncbi:hypothetical protein [Enterobacter huaxiensis]|uniref:hypothetical protein n=1 Tax=Enterobacter huaxiensis TaxID=2494702 RepID=UPI0021D9C707|nr:hypothetical protein [Enterobacter huaxiensis]
MNMAKLLIKKRKTTVFILLIFIFILSVFTYIQFRHRVVIDCDGDFVFRAPQNKYEIRGSMRLMMGLDRQGQIKLDGVATSDGVKTKINRDAIFIYHKINDTSFRMDNLRVIKGERDTASDKDFAEYFYSLALETRRVLNIHAIEDVYLVGNYRAPVFMCIPL